MSVDPDRLSVTSAARDPSCTQSSTPTNVTVCVVFHVDDVNDSDELDALKSTSNVMFDVTDTCTNDDGCDVRRTPNVDTDPFSLTTSPVDPTSTRPAPSTSDTVPFTPHAATARD